MISTILTALENGLNIKLLLIATGLDHDTFKQYLDNDLFTAQMRADIKETIRD